MIKHKSSFSAYILSCTDRRTDRLKKATQLKITRMKTSISSEALSQFRAEKIAFLPNLADGRKYGRTLVIIE